MFNMFHNKLRHLSNTKFRQSRMKKSAKSSSREPPSTLDLWTKVEISHHPPKIPLAHNNFSFTQYFLNTDSYFLAHSW